MIEVTCLPNQRRPRAGRKPVSEGRRPWLPQHARLCPVLESGSAIGCLVYPPLDDNESYQVRYLPGNVFRFSFLINDERGNPDLAFAIQTTPSGGSGGLMADDLVYHDREYGMSEETIKALKDALFVNVDTPPGAVGLRGATDFRTPEGWDTVYTAVFNQPQSPHIPALTVRVQTDWYAHNTEFRFLLQPGEIISATGTAPIGQVFFIPRDTFTLRDGDDQDAARFRESQQQYWEAKAADQQMAPYGGTYSPHYRKTSRTHK